MTANNASLAPLTMQGVQVPRSNVDPAAFFRATRRQCLVMKTLGAFAGLGSTDTFQLYQTGIISGLSVKASGTLTVALPTGTCASTARWPYDLIKALRLSVNGQANLINCSGADLKVRDIMALGDLTDRGVAQGVGGASPGTTRTQGTLSLNTELWGVGQNVTAIAANAYPVELNWFVPIAMDQRNLVGAIFAQTSSTEIAVAIDWAPVGDLFTLTGTATATLTLAVVIEAWVYTIPQAPNGGVIVPDLSAFHSLIKTRYPAISNGLNEVKLVGQGVGRQLMRLYWRTFNGTVPAPLPVNATNVGQIGYRFGGNDTPESFSDGRHLAYVNERLCDSDIGSLAGYKLLDFCSEFAVRDSIDEGLASELRFLEEIPSGVTLTSPFIEYVQETLFLGQAGA